VFEYVGAPMNDKTEAQRLLAIPRLCQ